MNCRNLGTRPRSFISGNICFEFLVLYEVWMCDSEASFLLVNHCPLVKVYGNLPPFKIGNTKTIFPTLSSLLFVHKVIWRSHDWNKCFGHVSRQNWKWHSRGAPRANRTPFVGTKRQKYQLTNNWLWQLLYIYTDLLSFGFVIKTWPIQSMMWQNWAPQFTVQSPNF